MLGKTCSRDSGGIRSSDAGTAEQAALSLRPQKLQVHPFPDPTKETGSLVESPQLHVEDHPPQKPNCP